MTLDCLLTRQCYCYPDHKKIDPNLGLSCDSSARCSDTVVGAQDRFSLLVDKAAAFESTRLFFSNEGDRPLAWNLTITANPETTVWNISSSHGELPPGSTQEIILSVFPYSLQARAAHYTTRFSLNSTSPTPTPQPLSQATPIIAQVFVSATPDAQHSNVTLRNVSSVTASGTIGFSVLPVDNTGLIIRDASQIAYTAKLRVLSTLATLACGVFYDVASDSHEGECSLPALRAGEFAVDVYDYKLTLVGASAPLFDVTKCPSTYDLDPEDLMCKCDAGMRDTGFECVQCEKGTYNTVAGMGVCYECPATTTTNADRTGCSVCVAGYYMRDDVCVSCPSALTDCSTEGSTLESMRLRPGYWRADSGSIIIDACQFGKAACPGDLVPCPNRTDSWLLCACGYTGPLCAVCAKGYYTAAAGDVCEDCAKRKQHIPIITVATVFFMLAGTGLCSTYVQQHYARVYRRLTDSIWDVAKFKVVFSSYQIIASVSWSLEIIFPEPYQTLQAYLSSVMDLSLSGILPIKCLMRFSYHSHLLIVTLVPLVMIALLVGYAMFFDNQKRSSRSGTCVCTALMVSFLTLPTSSTALFRTFHCRTFEDNSRYLIADYR